VVFVPRGDDISSGWGRVGIRVGTCLRPRGDDISSGWGRVGRSQRAVTKNIWRGVLGSLGMPSMLGYPTKTIVPTRKPGNPTKNGEGPLPRGDEVELCGPANVQQVLLRLGTSHVPAAQYSSPPLCCCRSWQPADPRRLALMGLYCERRGQAWLTSPASLRPPTL
jgi:hypothetical protein